MRPTIGNWKIEPQPGARPGYEWYYEVCVGLDPFPMYEAGAHSTFVACEQAVNSALNKLADHRAPEGTIT